MIRAAAKAARNAAKGGMLWQAPGHYYSRATSRSDRRQQVAWDATNDLVADADLNAVGQERMAGLNRHASRAINEPDLTVLGYTYVTLSRISA